MSANRSQRGLALISALMIVSLAGILAAGRMFSLQLESQASRTLMESSRARLIALGIEELAVEVLLADLLDGDTDHRGESWASGLGTMNVGLMRLTGSIEDMQGRFNVNNLVTVQGTVDWIAANQFRRMLRILGLDETLAVKVVDWVDSDNLPQQSGGAEDEAYTRLDPPYQAPNRPLEDVSELLAVEGFDAASFSVLAPHITALPLTSGASPINLNTATEVVLMSLMEAPDQARAQRWRELQFSGGMRDLGQVQESLPPRMRERVSLSSNWFALRLAVSGEQTRFFMTSLLDRQAGKVRTRWRRQGLPAEAWLAPAVE